MLLFHLTKELAKDHNNLLKIEFKKAIFILLFFFAFDKISIENKGDEMKNKEKKMFVGFYTLYLGTATFENVIALISY